MYVSTPLLSSDTPEEGIGSPLQIIVSHHGCWELNSEPLEEQSVLLTTEPSLQPVVGLSYLSFYFSISYLYKFIVS